jgi:hypothetical protein
LAGASFSSSHDLPERGLVPVEAVEVAHERLHAAVLGPLEQVPVEAPLVTPLALLRQLPAHEQQLLARVRPHVAVQRAQVGELLPAIPGHLVQQ